MAVKNRLEVFTLKERTYEHQAQPMSGSKPVTLGQGYSTIVWVPEVEGSWSSIKKTTPAFAATTITRISHKDLNDDLKTFMPLRLELKYPVHILL
ncbi:hypothetical protein [Nostoc sp.]|uniref:hypothetical protein n=1 Tax=Nostoc sp. TaxID=1180 RepID=UPI002FFC005D